MELKQPRILRVQRGSEEVAVRQAAEVLKKGSLVVMPTDTVYGIAADPRMPGAEERLYKVKGRDRGKPIPLLVAGIAEVEKYGAIFGEMERRLAERFWPGPLTLVLKIRNSAERGQSETCPAVAGSEIRNPRTEGFRVPDNDVALALLREAGGILRVTSANLSGEPPALTAEEARRSLGSLAGAVLDAGAVSGGIPSTVVRVENKEIKILREGAITAHALSGIPRILRGRREVYPAKRGV